MVLRNPAKGETLTLTVVDEEEAPVNEATVTIGSDVKLTDSDGVVEFVLPYDDYDVTVEADGFATATETLAFRSNHKNFTITLETEGTTGTVTVTCIDESEQPVSKCQAYLGTEPMSEPPQTAENLVAYGRNESGNEITLQTFDPETFLPIGTDIPYGTYYIYADNDEADIADLLVYTGEVTVDNATITETITLT